MSLLLLHFRSACGPWIERARGFSLHQKALKEEARCAHQVQPFVRSHSCPSPSRVREWRKVLRRASTANGGANDGWCVCLFFGPPLLFVRTALHESRRRRSACHAPAWIFWRRRQFGWKGRVVADLCLTIGLVDTFGGCYVGRRMVLWPQNSFIFTLGFHSFHVDASRNLKHEFSNKFKT